jgi:hypothetical protein
MIHDVDETIRTLIRQDALPGSEVDVVFDAPTKDWSTRRNAPTLDVYLYDIREDLRRREVGRIDTHDAEGRITGRRHPPRHYKLSYLVTAWTQRPEDEHRLLSSVLACFNRHDSLPVDFLAGQLADLNIPVRVTIALPPPEDRALSDVWSALGGELKPSLDLVITLPLDTEVFEPAAALVTEQPRISLVSDDGPAEQGKRRKKDGPAAATGRAARAGAAKTAGGGSAEAGRAGGAGSAEGPGVGGAGEPGTAEGTGGAGAVESGAAQAAAGPDQPGSGEGGRTRADETVKAGTDAHPGRVFRLRERP